MMTSTADDFCQENSLRAIQNEYIVEYLFSFLSLKDIKHCRLQNRIWMKVGTKILRRRTHVLFDFRQCWGPLRNPNHKAIVFNKNNQMKEVSDHCKESTPENTPISAFAFHGGIEYFQLINFLDDVRNYTKELKIASPIYHEGNKRITIDISPKIPPHLTKLHIELHGYANVTLSLCFDQIYFVKDLHLDNCTIVVNRTEKRLPPSDITLGPGNKYIKNGTNVEFLINESFDLTLTKKINLNGKNLIVDFSDCANDRVERNVTLKKITARNWEMCNWKIKQFSLDGIPFLDKNFIQMEELTTENLQIDLSKIYNPTSLLKLHCKEYTTIAEAPFFLPNLNEVALMCVNCVSKLPYFTNNKNISKLRLENEDYYDDAISVNINDLPKGINELTLTAMEVHGNGVYQLQTLYMKIYFPIRKIPTVGAKFRPETFKIFYPSIGADEDEIQSVIQLLKGNSYGRLVIGHFYWKGSNVFNNSLISKYVDRQAGCYVFEGGKGRGLTEEEALRTFGDYIAN